jgi:hypothetical protein
MRLTLPTAFNLLGRAVRQPTPERHTTRGDKTMSKVLLALTSVALWAVWRATQQASQRPPASRPPSVPGAVHRRCPGRRQGSEGQECCGHRGNALKAAEAAAEGDSETVLKQSNWPAITSRRHGPATTRCSKSALNPPAAATRPSDHSGSIFGNRLVCRGLRPPLQFSGRPPPPFLVTFPSSALAAHIMGSAISGR